MHNKKIRWTLLLSAALLAGCGKQIPKDVIHPDKMEDILYDYHLTTAMSGNISYDENYKKEALRNYVYRKHHVTKAEFDSSMVWYTRHTENLAKIYTNLGKRFREEKKDVKRLLAMRENKPSMSQPGDTVDVWYNKTLYWLTDAPLSNKITFEIPTDSNFKAKDAFLWSANYIFLSNLQQQVTMGFNILFDNDSVSGKVAEVTASGIQSLYIKPDSAYKIKSINGFIYLTGDSVKAPGIIVDKISLIRYHELADTISIVAKDSVPEKSMSVIDKDTDSLKMDSVQMKEAVTPVRLKRNETICLSTFISFSRHILHPLCGRIGKQRKDTELLPFGRRNICYSMDRGSDCAFCEKKTRTDYAGKEFQNLPCSSYPDKYQNSGMLCMAYCQF